MAIEIDEDSQDSAQQADQPNEPPNADDNHWFFNVSDADMVDQAAQAGINISENDAATILTIATRFVHQLHHARLFHFFVSDLVLPWHAFRFPKLTC